jgi:Cof subfamily protein (haloacid dehalogenase superfamily)
MIRLLVSDLDGTLLTNEKKVSKTDQIALKKLVDAGINICLATGRNKGEVEQVMQGIDLSYHQVNQNGAQVYTEKGQLLHSSQFSSQNATNLYHLIESFDLSAHVIIDAFLGSSKSEVKRVIPMEQKSYFQYEDDALFKHLDHLDEKIGGEVLPIKFSYFGKVSMLRFLEEEVHKRFPNQFTSFLVDKNCLDFMPLHVNKGTGLQFLLDHLDVSPNEVVCIGDSENDISMFDLIPHSFAMKTASSHVQSKASRTAASVAEAAEWLLNSRKSAIQL